MKNKQLLAWYQLSYGFVGVIFNAYLLLMALNTNQGAQVFLVFCFLIIFSSCVFLAGLSRYKLWRGNLLFSLIMQLVQVASISIYELTLNLRCGASVNLIYERGIFTSDLNLTDFASALSWKMGPSSNHGINLFAIVICVFLLAEIFDKRTPDKHDNRITQTGASLGAVTTRDHP